MKQDDQVFFLTLIDFFIQIIFFGLFIFAISALVVVKPSDPSADKKAVATNRLLGHFGISDIVELTDKLTRLSPAQLEHAVDLYRREGSPPQIENLLELGRTYQKDKEVKSGAFKPHCLFDTDAKGNQIARPLASIIAFDDSISFLELTPELETLLTKLGYNFNQIRSLSLEEFKMTFDSVIKIQPDCRYTVRVQERTRYVEPRDAIQSAFYTQKIPKRKLAP